MNTIKLTTIVITFCSSSFLMLNHPVHRKRMPVQKPLVTVLPNEGYTEDKPILMDKLRDNFTNDWQQNSMKRELSIIRIKKDDAQGVIFRIQVLSLWKPISPVSQLFEDYPEVRTYFSQGMYTYTVGEFKSPGESNQMFFELNAKGFEDAFIVAFKDDRPIPVKQAMTDILK
jgi:hypothetical protein